MDHAILASVTCSSTHLRFGPEVDHRVFARDIPKFRKFTTRKDDPVSFLGSGQRRALSS